MSAGRKQVKITADLVARTLHALDELNVPYVVLIEGIPASFTNSSRLHAAAIVEQSYLLANKIQEIEVEAEADKQTAIPRKDES